MKAKWTRQPALHCPKHDARYEQGAMCYRCDEEFTKAIGNMEIHDADVAWLRHLLAKRVNEWVN